jgi:hypothetical protein
MLSIIEQKLTSILGDDLVGRAHLDVLEAPTPLAPAAGRGAVLISIGEWTPATIFEREQFAFNGAQSRRVLPIQFKTQIDCVMHPAGNNAAQLASARDLLLTDVSLVSHGLARAEIQNGKGFAVADPDPGFRVLSFALETAAAIRDADATSGLLLAQLHYRGSAEIWPPGVVQDEGQILAIDTTSVSLPVEFTVNNPVLRAGQSATINTPSLPLTRLLTQPTTRGPLQLAVTVLSDAPPAQRGVISSGSAGQETGFRIIDVAPQTTAITYQTPAAAIARMRIEYVAVHLATPDGHSGVFLGSVALRLQPD